MRERGDRHEHLLVGIDQSFSNYAMVLFKDGVPIDRVVYHTGDPTAKKNKGKQYGKYFENPILQLDYLYGEVLVKLAEWNPNDIAMEGLAFGSSGQYERNLAALYFGMMVSLHRELGYHYNNLHTVTPTQAKALAREFMIGDEKYHKENGIITTLKSGKRKLNPMNNKAEMIKALGNTSHGWLVDGYTRDGLTLARTRETGLEDIPDSFWIASFVLENTFGYKFDRPT
jgi:hypothetical protein